MILLTFRTAQHDRPCLGVKTSEGVIDVKAALNSLGPNLGSVPDTPEAVYSQGLSALPSLGAFVSQALPSAPNAPWLLGERSLVLDPPVPNPTKILCVGLNYRGHIAESGAEVPEVPVLFSKFNNALVGSGAPVPLPNHVVEYDYEAELAAVIGRRARYISPIEALDYVLGYCNANDISARELQRRTSQWLLGKTLDKFLPLGPYLVTADEVGDPQQLSVRCWLNGELRQDSSTADMVFSVAQIVSYASQYLTLEPGDIICTGTPPGVVLGMDDKTWMKPGDEVTVQVGNLGRLTSRMIDEGVECAG
jgi:2-keto-4-pentenoate hydratase/2-oxohepta-3-ene-1,7-dioic acid hydratase in catechol pathway